MWSGYCRVLTSTTMKSKGRRFYRCPAKGGADCQYFDWVEEDPTVSNSSSSIGGDSSASRSYDQERRASMILDHQMRILEADRNHAYRIAGINVDLVDQLKRLDLGGEDSDI